MTSESFPRKVELELAASGHGDGGTHVTTLLAAEHEPRPLIKKQPPPTSIDMASEMAPPPVAVTGALGSSGRL